MQIRGKMILLVLAAGLAAGCATTRNIWSKSGVSAKQAMKDLSACAGKTDLLYDRAGLDGKPLVTSTQRTTATKPFESCMTGKGYRVSK